jgi:hypothetical protein
MPPGGKLKWTKVARPRPRERASREISHNTIGADTDPSKRGRKHVVLKKSKKLFQHGHSSLSTSTVPVERSERP